MCFYRDYPEIYDRFGRVPKTPTAVEALHHHFPLTGKTVAGRRRGQRPVHL